MRLQAKNIILVVVIIALTSLIGCGQKSNDKEILQSGVTQTTSNANITLTESAVKTTPTESAIETKMPTKQAIEKTAPNEVQEIDTSKGKITLSKDEITSGKVSVSQVGGALDYTFSTDELKEFVDFFNSFNLTEKDKEGESKIHTASENPIAIILEMNDGTKMFLMAFWDGETYVTDNKNSYSLFNKDLSDYLLGLNKYIYPTDTSTSEAIQQLKK